MLESRDVREINVEDYDGHERLYGRLGEGRIVASARS